MTKYLGEKNQSLDWFFNVADAAGVEPATAWFVARYSIQLSYASAINCFFISQVKEITNRVHSH